MRNGSHFRARPRNFDGGKGRLTSIASGRLSEPPLPRSPLVNEYPVSTRPVRKKLDHSTHYPARFGATFFITICCEAGLQISFVERISRRCCSKPAVVITILRNGI